MDQIHERNNKLRKECGKARDLLDKLDHSVLIRWETCSPEIARVILEFENCLDRNEIVVELSTKHREDSLPFHQRFSSDVSRMVKCITINLFMQDQVTKLNKKIIVPATMRTVVDDLEAMGEKQ